MVRLRIISRKKLKRFYFYVNLKLYQAHLKLMLKA
jgi:hypothetical protein